MITKAANGDTAPRVSSVSERRQWDGLRKRILSAAVLSGVVVALVYVGGTAFVVTVAVLAALMAYEWNQVSGDNRVGILFGGHTVIVGAIILIVYKGSAGLALGVGIGGILIISALTYFQKKSTFWPGLGIIYIAIPCASLIWLRDLATVGMILIYWSFAVVWATDTGAYAFGKAIGGPLLAPRISPKKTWAGLIGGTMCGTAAGALVAVVTGLASVWILAIFSFVLTFAAHGGDLVESAIKRRFGTKDSGKLIPGHGGVLDLIDGLIFVWPSIVGTQVLHSEGIIPWVAR